MFNERIRVACVDCGANRDKSLTTCCHVCGSTRYKVARPTAGDIERITTEVVDSAERVEALIFEHSGHSIDKEHPAALRLKAACRHLALARAGCLSY